ncbi:MULTISPECIES: exonuclease SbcCD subunit D [unclassified Acinetobacter]|uniref:exonuclease SbcCD subunit D n=1 Tax=unclassified Acinetobacter TaxID=196816 RepID=UPI0035BAAD71
MAVHFFHTSDWHLGQLFFHYPRDFEHQQFLNWLIAQLAEQQPDALLIAGDIYDTVNPSAHAQKQLYEFIAKAHAIAPHLQILMIAGNHDSGYRIEQVAPLLSKYQTQAIGTIEWQTSQQEKTNDKENHQNTQNKTEKILNTEKLIVPIYNREQQIVAWVVALPYLRSAEITGFNRQTEQHDSAIAYIHSQLIATARNLCQPHQALIVMSHAHLQGGEVSESERPIVIGNEDALSIQLFGDGVDYVALGHLHKPQKVKYPHIRYSGSPIPLSLSEKKYQHQVLSVKIDPTQDTEHRIEMNALHIPRSVEILHIRGEIDDILQQLSELPSQPRPLQQRDYVYVEYQCEGPTPLDLRHKIENNLVPDSYRLLKIQRTSKQIKQTESPQHTDIDMVAPTPQQLFRTIWEKNYSADQQVYQDFDSLVEPATHALQEQQGNKKV